MKTKNIKYKYIETDGKRIDGKFFLNKDAFLSFIMKENEDKCLPLSEFANLFNPPVFKRQFCQKTEKSVQYFQSSDVPAASEQSNTFINKNQAEKVNALVKENQILITGFGSIGNVRLVSKLQDGVAAYANNSCRVEVDHEKYGFIYAFLASKYGKAQLNKNASGSVVRYIEAPGIKKTLIPLLLPEKRNQIHNLIIESASLRVEANINLAEAVSLFENRIGITKVSISKQVDILKISKVKSFLSRLDGQYQIITKKLEGERTTKYDYIKIGNIAKRIFVGSRGKRNYVEFGIPFLSSSDIMLFNPMRYAKQISNKTPNLESLLVGRNDILISRSGTVGNVVLVGDDLENSAVSEHALRLEIDENKIAPEYVFCFLKTKQGKTYMEASAFGSVIITLNEELIGNIEIPILDDADKNSIVSLIKNYQNNIDSATIKENQAIQLVENEIEQWQH